MATLSVDEWALRQIDLDFADQAIPDVLIANGGDADGRGIDLRVNQGGVAASLVGMTVFLAWGHECGAQGLTPFKAVDAAKGHFKAYYPAQMQRAGTVVARVLIYVGAETPITGSRNFRIFIERSPIDDEAAVTSDDFGVFAKAVIDLHEALGEFETSSSAQLVSQQRAYEEAEAARGGLYSNAEESRQDAFELAEASRGGLYTSAEKTRQSTFETAEGDRAAAEAARETEFEQIRQSAQHIRTVLLADGQYDQETRIPTVEGEQGVTYYVPADDPTGSDGYAEWQYLLLVDGTRKWEKMGSSDAVLDAVTTADIDSVIDGGSPSGTRYMALSSLKYWFSRVRALFAPKDHSDASTAYGASSAGAYGHARASRTAPKANGIVALGIEESSFARGDHVHPLQRDVAGSSGSCTGLAAYAGKLQHRRRIAVSGDASGYQLFDGGGDATIYLTIAAGKVTPDKLDRAYSVLGVRNPIDSSTDLDDLTVEGCYEYMSNDMPQNAPPLDLSGGWTLDVDSVPQPEGRYYLQRATCVMALRSFARYKIGGWGPWKEVAV